MANPKPNEAADPGVRRLIKPRCRRSGSDIAAIYDRAGDDYLAYADGGSEGLFSFAGAHAYADRRLWSLLDNKLKMLRATGATSLRVLDAGCGPGTWVRRVISRALRLGFTNITARGFDVSATQIETARRLGRDLAALRRVKLMFDVRDLLQPLPEPDRSVDIALCLYSVLSHLPARTLPKVAAEFARVTRGDFITTVRAIGSTPTVFVDSIEQARYFKLDHEHDQCEIEFRNGSRVAVGFHLFTAGELRVCFGGRFDIEDIYGLDIFHSRFLPDRRWNPASVVVDAELVSQLESMEKRYARDPRFMERATHLLLVGNPRPAPAVQKLRRPGSHASGHAA